MSVVGRLSTLDRFLPVWIGLAMLTGLLLGRLVTGLGDGLARVEGDGVSLPIAVGLLVMMYPVLAKVRYDKLDSVTADRRLLVSSLVLNWLVGSVTGVLRTLGRGRWPASTTVDPSTLAAASACVNMDHRRCR